VDALAAADDHCTADALAAEVQRAHPQVHKATIYRNLDALRRLGVVEHTHLGHGPAVYHLADEPHDHLVCDACGSVQQVPASLLRGVERAVKRDYGFEMRPRHFALGGLCGRCAAPGAQPGEAPSSSRARSGSPPKAGQ
jgi:Fur family transcriptional regulator, ferric uptake regulator